MDNRKNTDPNRSEKIEYLAHISEDGERAQLLSDHLTHTAQLAAAFAEPFGSENEARAIALLHDVGKASTAFQKRLHGGTPVDHSTAGAIEAYNRFRILPLAACIAGHHAGLPDSGSRNFSDPTGSTLWGRLKKKIGPDIRTNIPPYDANAIPKLDSLPKLQPPFPMTNPEWYLYTKFLYSALTDADFLDTEEFMTGEQRQQLYDTPEILLKKLEDYITGWKSADSALNRRRTSIRETAEEKADSAPGAFTLTVPTGGGKTITSMMFALRHAVRNGMRRVIYVIPYTSIIEQTLGVFEAIFGKENVLAHYAGADYFAEGTEKERTDDEEDETARRHRLASENWDAPIILTTSVQFFESFYSNRSSRCRKLHNIARSILIFDEAQMLPVHLLRPCLFVMSQLVRHYGCSLVLCTATQPSVNRILAEEEMLGAVPMTELCPEPEKMYELFRRVTYCQAGTLSDEALSVRLAAHSQVLCIVNKKRHARALYELLPDEGRYHLSTLMTPNDRTRTLDEIRSRLKEGLPCRVVSTSLIEAGVDVDFPAVYRERAGLDSLIQAAGRCNREGKRSAEDSPVFLFRPENETLPTDLLQNASATDHVLRQYEDIASLEAIREYFDFLLYQLKDDTMLDQKKILKTICQNPMQFAEVAEEFHLIETEDCTVVIPNPRIRELLNVIEHSGIRRGMLRILGQDSVSIPSYIFNRLKTEGVIRPLDSSGNTAVLCNENRYRPDCGLDLSAQEMQTLNW